MAITYHAGRRIQGNETTYTNVTTSSTGSTGNATNNGSGFTATTGLFGAGMSQASGNYKMTNEPVLGDEWSFNFWCKPVAATGNDYFMQMDSDSGTTTSAFYMYNHSSLGLNMSVFDSTGVNLGISTDASAMWLAFTNGSWNMITMTWNNSDKKLRTYKNGVLYETGKAWTHTSAGNMAASNRVWYMLNYNSETGTDYASNATNLDEWSWWTGTLSQADITALYNNGTGIKASDITGVNKTKLIVYYDFQDSPNGTLTNQAPTTATYTVRDSKPTNVQVGSRFEETDTRKMYHFEAGSPTYETTYPISTGWTQVNTASSYWAIASTTQQFQNRIANNGSGANYDLGLLDSYDEWLLRFELTVDSSLEVQYNGDAVTVFGIQGRTDNTSSVGGSYGTARAQVQMQIATANSTRRIQAKAANDTTVGQSTAALNFEYTNNTKYYIEVKKTGATSYTIGVGTNSDYTTGRTEGNITATLTGLRYLHFESWGQNASYESRNGGIIENLKFYAGTSTDVMPIEWSEEGT